MIKSLKYLLAPLLFSTALGANAGQNSDICANLSGDWVGKATFNEEGGANAGTADIKFHISPRSGDYTYEVVFSTSNVTCGNSKANCKMRYPAVIALTCRNNHITMEMDTMGYFGSLNNNQISLVSDSNGSAEASEAELNLHR